MKDLEFELAAVAVLQAPSGEPRNGPYATGGKRALDVGLALLLLPVLAPVIFALWLIARADGGAGFFGHLRIGRDGSTFRCWKIRTMVVDAEDRLAACLRDNADAAAEWDRTCKLDRDPRITRFGGFLRRTGLDELPQIWNVLAGEMSLVGPRPVVRQELARYGDCLGLYLAMTPGITGLWQISGRNGIGYDQRVRLDARYFRDLSLALDLRILFGTVVSILRGDGR